MANGHKMALTIIGGNIIFQFLIIFGICSMLVPKPILNRPDILFSLYPITAKPIICTQQPTVAAPAANPLSDRDMAMAALEMGKVSNTPITTAKTTPIKKVEVQQPNR